MFPTLFLGGCGGPNEKRARRISLRKWILRCLSLAGHRFERHCAFVLLAFDFLALRNARRSLYVKMKVSTTALAAGNISHEAILESINYYNHLTYADTHGIQPNPVPEAVSKVIDVRKGLNTSESAYFGSNLSRMRARHDLFGYLQCFGVLQIFFTISPDSSGTYSIAVKSGEVSQDAVATANIVLLPNRAERKRIAGRHPMQCARYFERVMDTVIEYILGWDTKQARPRRGGGIFGIVRAFGGTAETQQAGDLHAHFAVWLHGFPQTSASLREALSSNEMFKARLLQFADIVATTSMPALDKPNICPQPCRGRLDPTVVDVSAFRRPLPGQKPPVTSVCTVCRANYRDKDLINNAINSLIKAMGTTTLPGTEDYLKCRAANCEESQAETKLSNSIAIRDVQVHYWSHSKSCFKITSRTPKGSVCRFLKPDAPCLLPTHIEENGRLQLRRCVGCEYLNAYNPVVMRVFKCNHDVQLVFGSDKRNVAAYVCVRSASSLPPNSTPAARGHRILASMLYSITNGQEVAATMAALYLLRESPFWFSHQVVHLDSARLLEAVNASQEVTILSEKILSGKPPEVRAVGTLLCHYWKRQDEMEMKCFAQVCERYQLHPQSRKTSIAKTFDTVNESVFVASTTPKVIILSGRPLPDLSTKTDVDSRDFYFSTLLMLFKPHRRSEFVALGANAKPLYHEFVRSGTPDAVAAYQKFQRHWTDFYMSQSEPDATGVSAEEELIRTPPDDGKCCVENENLQFDNENDDESDHSDAGDLPFATYDASSAHAVEAARAIVQAIPNLTAVVEAASYQYPDLQSMCERAVPCTQALDEFLERLREQPQQAKAVSATGTTDFIATYPEMVTRLSMFKECFEPVPWRESLAIDGELILDKFPSIAQVALSYRLNFWQHVVFEMVARHLLYSYLKDVEDAIGIPEHSQREPYQLQKQLIAYLGGEAGTGKSTVIHAILTFADAWGRTGTVETIAFTGVAAANIRGKTMHSARNLKITGVGQRGLPTQQMKKNYEKVVLTIVDEISMTDQALLGRIDLASRGMSTQSRLRMGGKHVMLCGDWFQLPAIRGTPCYIPPIETASRYHHAGFDLYNAVNFVVFLAENMRSRTDALYTRILASLRWGKVSQNDLERLNSRVDQYPPTNHVSTTFYRPVVVSTNKVRCAINKLMIFNIGTCGKQQLYELPAEPSKRSAHIFTHLLDANDDLTERIPMRLFSFIGMPIMITRKPPQLKYTAAISNGTLDTIIGYYPTIDDVSCMQIESDAGTVSKPLQAPKLILVRLRDCNDILVHGFERGVVGVPRISVSISLRSMPNLTQASITVKQFPLVPAFACTTEKLQGKTCPNGVVVTNLHRLNGVPPQTLYVALSRTKTLDSLTLAQPLTSEYIDKFKPETAAAEEMKRLINMIDEPPYMSQQQRILHQLWKAEQNTV